MSFSVTILGSNSALPTEKRFPTAQALNINEKIFLIDCGEGTQIQLRKFSIRFGKINHIFISHLHGDHYFGLLGLIFSFSLLGRKHDLHLYSHPQLEDILACQLKHYGDDLGFRIVFNHFEASRSETIYEDKLVTVESIPMKHRIPTAGFLFREKLKDKNIRKEMIDYYHIPIRDILKIKKGADFETEDGTLIKNEILTLPPSEPCSYAFCTDTVYNVEILDQIRNVDLLYHEATFGSDLEEQAAISFHSTARQAAFIAKQANVKKLIIGHFSERYKDITPLLKEARTVFPETYSAEDGEVFFCKATATGTGNSNL